MINTEYTLPCGAILKNRLVKAAMTERIGDRNFEPVKGHQILYESWAETGAGLLITGNVMIDRKYPESAGNIAFDDEAMLPKLALWARSAQLRGSKVWVQISHAGRQTSRFNNLRPLAPSPVQFKKMGLFGKPKAMSEIDIEKVIDGFVKAAKIAKKAGFDGIQIHSAHGYLLSQFLSPKTNLRTDQWGGSIESRARLLLTILRKTREEVGPDFPIGLKLNSSDFQKGGLTEEESLQVIKMLNTQKIDLLEISGGTYENVAFFLLNEKGKGLRKSTRQREAYFMDFAKKVRAVSQIPLMITGGFRTYDFCTKVLENKELDLIGMGRPFVTNLDEIPAFIKGNIGQLNDLVIRTGIPAFDDAAEGGYYARQIIRFSKGKNFKKSLSPLYSSIFLIMHEAKRAILRKLLA